MPLGRGIWEGEFTADGIAAVTFTDRERNRNVSVASWLGRNVRDTKALGETRLKLLLAEVPPFKVVLAEELRRVSLWGRLSEELGLSLRVTNSLEEEVMLIVGVGQALEFALRPGLWLSTDGGELGMIVTFVEGLLMALRPSDALIVSVEPVEVFSLWLGLPEGVGERLSDSLELMGGVWLNVSESVGLALKEELSEIVPVTVELALLLGLLEILGVLLSVTEAVSLVVGELLGLEEGEGLSEMVPVTVEVAV